jgi:hypothetical protein
MAAWTGSRPFSMSPDTFADGCGAIAAASSTVGKHRNTERPLQVFPDL